MSTFFYETRTENLFAGDICDHPFPLHVHDPVEIVSLIAGRVRMTVDGKTATLEKGDIAVCFPSIPHSYDAVSEDAQGLTLIFAPETISDLMRVFRTTRPVTPFLTADQKDPELDWITRKLLYLPPQADRSFKSAYLHVFLAHLLQCVELKSADSGPERGMSHQLLHYVSEHFTEPLSLESVAHALGISRIHVSHIFSQQLRIHFRQYINTLRIDRACTLLRDPSCSVSQVAYLCGYDNPRTFHRAFQTQCGCTPRQFREGIVGEQTAE